MKITKEFVVKKIREWEMDAGESFFDSGLIEINPLTLMTWCLGKGYITPEKYNMWADAFNANMLEANDENYYIYDYGSGEVDFAIVNWEEDTEEEYDRALLIFGEFVSEIEVYTERFNKFVFDKCGD